MKKWIQNLKIKLNERIERAYGIDDFSMDLIFAGMFFSLLDLFPKFDYCAVFGVALLIWGCFRCYSTNIEIRQKEQKAYDTLKITFAEWISETYEKMKDKIKYKYVRCPHCGAIIKLPRGLGKISIKCPNCGNCFEHKI